MCSSGRLKFFFCHSTFSAHAISCMLLFDTCKNSKFVDLGQSKVSLKKNITDMLKTEDFVVTVKTKYIVP